MSRKVRLAAAAACVAIAGLSAFAVEPSADQLRNEISDLRAQVSELTVQQSQDQSAVAATIQQVLRNAEQRSQLLATGGDAGAGYDNGFFIRAGEFVIKPVVNFQFRNVTDYRQNTDGTKQDEIENGFEIRRLQLGLEGNAFTKDLSYQFQWNTSTEGGGMFLEDAWVKYMFADAWGVKGGQYKAPFSHEKFVSDKRLLSVERSMLDGLLGGGWSDRIQGVSLIYGGQVKDNPVNIEVALTDGANSDNTSYVGHYPGDPAVLTNITGPAGHAFDFGVYGRAEYKAMGDWKNYQDFTGAGIKENLLVLGAGFEWNQGGNGDEIAGTVDVQFKHTCGAAIYGGLIVHHVASEVSATGSEYTDWGLVLQVSYAINPQWEPFIRWSMVKYDDEVAVGTDTEDTFHEIAIGVAYYLGQNGSAGNRAKVTMDLNWLPSGAPRKMSGQDYLGDSGGEDEIVLRGQFQLSL